MKGVLIFMKSTELNTIIELMESLVDTYGLIL